jgi:hypothetical protein
MDNLKKKRPHDTARISLQEPWEIKYWCNELGVSEDELRKALDSVGNDIERIKSYLARAESA